MSNLKKLKEVYINSEPDIDKIFTLAALRKINQNINIIFVDLDDKYKINITDSEILCKNNNKYQPLDNDNIFKSLDLNEEEYIKLKCILDRYFEIDNFRYEGASICTLFTHHLFIWNKKLSEIIDKSINFAGILLDIFIEKIKSEYIRKEFHLKYEKSLIILLDDIIFKNEAKTIFQCKWIGYPLDNHYIIEYKENHSNTNELINIIGKFAENDNILIKYDKEYHKFYFKNKKDAETFAEKYLK